MTLRIKASILLVVIITVSLAASGYYHLNYFEKSLRNSIYKGLDSVSSTASREISKFLMDGLKEAEAIAEALPKIAIEQKNAAVVDRTLRSYFSIFKKICERNVCSR
jgi:hypothetical protein